MKVFRKTILPILVASMWISLSEFIRNEFLFKSYWTGHYSELGLIFPSEPINGAIWGLWSLLYAIFIHMISRKFSLAQTTFIAWFAGFILMWVVTWNMGVLPISLLWFAIPLSILEAFVASFIIHKMRQ